MKNNEKKAKTNRKIEKKTKKMTNLGVLAPETNSWGDLVEIHQKIVQIGALAATFWAKTDVVKIPKKPVL